MLKCCSFRGVKLVSQAKLLNLQDIRWTATIAADPKVCFDNTALASAKSFEEMPSMLMLPYIGTGWIYLPILGRYKVTRFVDAAKDKQKRLGDIFREKVGPLNMVWVFNPDDVKTVFEFEGPYPFRIDVASIKKYRESRKHWYKNPGLMILKGKEWWDLRSKVQKHMMKPKAVIAFLDPMQDVAKDLVDKMYKVRDSNKEVPEFLEELYNWALESVALVGLDTRLGCLKTDLDPSSDGLKMIHAVQTTFKCMLKLEAFAGNLQLWKLFPTPTWKKFTAASDVFTEIAAKHINRAVEELKNVSEDKDLTLLQTLLMEKDLDASGALVMVTDMLMAGIDSTSNFVGFFLYHMAKNPEKQELLYQDIKRFLPNKDDRITPAIFNELKYLKACIKESHRMDPVASGTARIVDHDIVLSGYRVPAGVMIISWIQNICRDARYFSNPDQYIPERWFKKEEKFNPFSFLPFGFGTRSCVGRRIAELETICVITEIIKNFRIEYHYEDIGILTRGVNTPDKPLRFNFIER